MTARERIQLLERNRLLPRLEPVDGRQKELVRTGGEFLQGRDGIRPSRKAMGVKRVSQRLTRLVQAIVSGPPRVAPSDPPRTQRARERGAELQEIAPASLHRLGVALVQQRQEDGQIVLGVVDGARRIARCRPGEPCLALG